MYRTGGIVTILIGLAVAFLWGFLPFTQQHSYRVSFGDDQPTWTRVEIPCPAPWSVLVYGERPPRGEYATVGDECVRPARTFMTGGLLALIAGVTIGIWGISRGRRTNPEPIEPLSKAIEHRSQSRSD